MSIYDKASLVLIPSGSKTSKVYSQKPTNGDGDFTFSRSTAATRVNASGNIEKETQNLFLQSNSFTTAPNDDVGISISGNQAGYDGTNDAWLITKNGTYSRLEQDITFSGLHTISIYAKAGSYDWIMINDGVGNAYFDLANGVLGSSFNYVDHSIESVGNGWYRCSATSNGSRSVMRFYPMLDDANFGVSPWGSVYIQDAQLEQGLVARDYIETTTTAIYGGITDNVPRLDYTDSSCPALLLEPQRTNLVNHSEYFGDSSWSKTSAGGGSNAVVTDNYGVSPEGLQNAARLQLNLNGGTSASDISYIAYYYAATGVATTNSVYMKSLSGTTNVRIRCGSTFESVDVTTDWQRFDVTDSSTSDRFQVLIYGGINSDTADLLIWGAQGEAGSYATSYIPTYGSAVTRNADDCDALSATSLIGQSEGTLFLDFVANDEDALQIIYQVRTTGSSNVGQIDFRIQGGNLRALGNDASTGQFNISAGAAVVGTRYKCAVRYKNNDVAFYVNGILKGTDTSASFSSSSLDQITFNENGTTFYPIVNVNQALIIPTALTNAELADLTTL